MRTDWREVSAEREAGLGAPRDQEADRRTVDELNAWIEGTKALSDETQRVGAEDLDYAIRSRWVPAVKGKVANGLQRRRELPRAGLKPRRALVPSAGK